MSFIYLTYILAIIMSIFHKTRHSVAWGMFNLTQAPCGPQNQESFIHSFQETNNAQQILILLLQRGTVALSETIWQ